MNVEQTDVGANKWMNKIEKAHSERANLVDVAGGHREVAWRHTERDCEGQVGGLSKWRLGCNCQRWR